MNKIRSLINLFLALLAFNPLLSFGQECDLNSTKERRKQVELIERPFNYVVQMDMRRGKTFHGTSFFIHPRVLLTAGHNLRKRPQFIFTRVKSITLKVGATSPNNYLAIETITTIQNENIFTLQSFNKRYNIFEDFGIIILPDENLYNKIGGHFKLTVFDEISHNGKEIQIAGYPRDKPECTMWTDKTENYFSFINENSNPLKSKYLKYDFTTESGVSGAPVWYNENGLNNVFAIHTYGNDNDDRRCNTATIITAEIFNQILEFCDSKGIEIN